MKKIFIAILMLMVTSVAAAKEKVNYEAKRVRAVCFAPSGLMQYELGKNNVADIVVLSTGVKIVFNEKTEVRTLDQVNVPCTVIKQYEK